MAALEKITISPGLAFDALVSGEPGARLVLLLHGFAESMHCWRAQVTALAAAGYRAVAPSQRGYSPRARPDPNDTANYHIDRLMDDAMAVVAACGYGEARLHLVGHDWGGRIRTPSIARYRCPTASRRSGRGTTRPFSNPTLPMWCWPTIRNGCANAC